MLRRLTLLLALLAPGVPLAADPVAAAVAEVQIAASGDDAEQNASGSVSIVGSDLELVWDGNSQTVGLRFPGLGVPQGARITDAWVQFESDETSATVVSVDFQAEASDNAVIFNTTAQNVATRARTTETVTWSPAPWTTIGVAGPDQRTPSLAALVQAVVSRPGWAAGHALALIVSGSGTGKRTARSFDTGVGEPPLLHVEYDAVDANAAPTVTITSPANLTQWQLGEPIPL